ncbi:hypothetical protein K2173_012439 [Erythroxylum novogranatense]|uniref:Retrotransposon Copia-like N-terminal domain-containing protein n=1 Tax=Erythroxylum novogranatense TaxID=1862640 RepID=A0AAV8TLZ5_9ROSI|nr:hypothetical protein K2173_012439 [Erythroxylum novogranatense]
MTELIDPQITISSPYFLHPNENPSLILVSPALTSSNYNTWSRAMRLALLSKNKLQFVDSTILAPTLLDPMYPAWERCNTMVISWLNHSVSPSIFSSDIYRISDLQEEISIFKQDDKSVTDYFTELKILWDELLHFRPLPACSCATPCSCGVLQTIKRYNEDDCVIRFLKGLNDKYLSVRSQIMLLDPLPTINKVFSMVIQQERQFAISASKVFVNNIGASETPSDSSVHAVTKKPIAYSNVDKRFCTYCQWLRHTVETCFKKNGFPPGYKVRGPTRANNIYSDDVAEHSYVSVDNSANNSGLI